MINRETRQVVYRAYDNTKDAYGQLKQNSVDRPIEMMIKIRGQVNVTDPRFVDCDAIGITQERTLTAGNKIVDGDVIYLIQYIIPSFRYQQVFLKCES